ncbi:endonuclease III domain-containing protein [Roseobacter sp. MH60115]|uniref:endonuclease III domain-containing protein n=1 Tax=Roseobacter sp. MH60115 TaxID=2785324 RepID=UPI0018A27410|nr:Fe-S cluster assembly protein HesB [Roseobacter sp. MH60115]
MLLDPVSQLVMGLIGGKTRGDISTSVFRALKGRFRDWESLRDAPVQEIRHLIAPVTFAEVKARRLKSALQMVTASQGALTLDLLKPMSVSASLNWLEKLPGVGRKTAATVLNFSTLRKPALVIDTHHLRVARRLGLIRQRAGTVEAFEQLSPLLPQQWGAPNVDSHHQLIKRHGQRQCPTRWPTCHGCCLADLCDTYRATRRV